MLNIRYFLSVPLGGFILCVFNLHSIHVLYSPYFSHKESGSHSNKSKKLVQGHTLEEGKLGCKLRTAEFFPYPCLRHCEQDAPSVFWKSFFSLLRWISFLYIKKCSRKKLDLYYFCELGNLSFRNFSLKIYSPGTSGRNKISFFLEALTTNSSLTQFSGVAPLNTIFYSKPPNNMNESQKINKQQNNMCRGFRK